MGMSWKSTAALAGLPLAAYILWRSGSKDWFSEPVQDTDFDSFLVKQGAHPTGLAPTRRKRRANAWWSWQPAVSAAERGKVSGPFETFLKAEAGHDDDSEDDHRNPLDFNSFLKTAQPSKQRASSAGANGQAAVSGKQLKPAAAGPTADQVRILVMFGTEYGFSKEIAEKLTQKLREADKYWCVHAHVSHAAAAHSTH
jgi:hypothetical protein